MGVRSHWAGLPSAHCFTLAPEKMSLWDNFLMEKKKTCRNKEENGAEMLLGGGEMLIPQEAWGSEGPVPILTHFAALLGSSLLCRCLLPEFLTPSPQPRL